MRFAFLFILIFASDLQAGICGRLFAFVAGLPAPLPVKPIAFTPEQIPDEVPLGDGLSLSRAQFLALARAEASGNYHVRLARQTIDGVPRLVVLLGEAHVKGKAAAALGREVLAQFPVRGLEGADLSRNWGGRALEFTLSILERAAKLFRFSGGSTIDQGRRGKPRVLDLEEGHVPDLKEQVASVYIPGLLVTCAATMCAGAYASAGLPAAHTVHDIASVAMAAISVHAVAGRILGPFVSERSGWRYFLNPILAMGPERSRTMARNLNEALHKNRELETVLVVVGRAHVPQVEAELEKEYRFTGGALPVLP